jgi:Tol biopolymer transport system component
MNLDGSDCFPLTKSNEENHRYPSWSSDGSKVIYYLIGSHEGPLYSQTATANSTDRTELARFSYGDDPQWLIDPSGGFSISPKGKLVCASHGGPQTNGILEIETPASKAGVKTLVPWVMNKVLESPVYSPDGSQIAYSLQDTETAGDQSISVNRIQSGGTLPVQLVKVKTYSPMINWMGYMRNTSLCYSPDGTKIIFTALTDPNGGYHLFVINADGSGLTQVTTKVSAYDYDVSWGRERIER